MFVARKSIVKEICKMEDRLMKRIILLLVFVIAFAPATPGQQQPSENRVEGSLTVQGKTYKLSYAYAKLTDSPNVKGSRAISLFFSNKPLPRKELDDLFKLRDKLKPSDTIALKLSIEHDKLFGSQVIFDGDTLNFSGFPEKTLDFAPETINASLVRGAASTKIPAEWFGKKYEFNVRFSAALSKNQWTGDFYTPPPTGLEPGKASGKLVIDGNITRLNHVYAQRVYDLFNEKLVKVKLTFTEKPIPDASASLFEMKRAGNAYIVQATISNEEESKDIPDIWNVAKLSSPNDAIAATPLFGTELELMKFGEAIAEGRIYLLKPKEWSDRTYEFDVSFKAAVPDSPDAPATSVNGKPLGSGGGEAGKAYLAYLDAIRKARTIEELEQVGREMSADADAKSSSIAKEIENDPRFDTVEKKKKVLEAMFQLIKVMTPDEATITGGFVRGDRATLSYVGSKDKNEIIGRVNMRLIDGRWKVDGSQQQLTGRIVKSSVRPAGKAPAAKPKAAPVRGPMAKSNGAVAGSFTINGRPVRLRYVYAMRRQASPPNHHGLIDLYITDQPVPEEVFRKIAEDEYHLYYVNSEHFQGTPVRGMHLCIDKGRSFGEVSYFWTLITPDAATSDMIDFASFNIQKGKLQARTSGKGDRGGLKWNYSLSINATLDNLAPQSGGAIFTRIDEAGIRSATSLPPEEGRASGNVTLKGKVTQLRYAYAWREKIFFDERDEQIYILITESPAPKERKIFTNSMEMGLLIGSDKIRGIRLTVDASGVVWAASFLLQSGTLTDSTDRTKVTEIRIENGRVKGKAEYQGEDGIRTFTVTFDAPLKN
jgi:hypothetical protein